MATNSISSWSARATPDAGCARYRPAARQFSPLSHHSIGQQEANRQGTASTVPQTACGIKVPHCRRPSRSASAATFESPPWRSSPLRNVFQARTQVAYRGLADHGWIEWRRGGGFYVLVTRPKSGKGGRPWIMAQAVNIVPTNGTPARLVPNPPLRRMAHVAAPQPPAASARRRRRTGHGKNLPPPRRCHPPFLLDPRPWQSHRPHPPPRERPFPLASIAAL